MRHDFFPRHYCRFHYLFLLVYLTQCARRLTYFVLYHTCMVRITKQEPSCFRARAPAPRVSTPDALLTKWVPRNISTGPTSSYTSYEANFSKMSLFTPLGRLLMDRLLWVGNHFTRLSSFSGHLFNKEFLPMVKQFAYRALPFYLIEYSIVSCMRHYLWFVHHKVSPRLIKEYYATPSLSHCR